MPRNRMNLFIAMATTVLFIATVLPINAFDDSLLLYLPFDDDTGGIAKDLTGRTGGGAEKLSAGRKSCRANEAGRCNSAARPVMWRSV